MVCDNENKIAHEITSLNVPFWQYKEQSTLTMCCLHFMVITPIFFSRLAETNSAYRIFGRQKKPTHNNEADERSKENESCWLGERLTLHINQGAGERTADRDVASGRC